jgi:hypothetical protein
MFGALHSTGLKKSFSVVEVNPANPNEGLRVANDLIAKSTEIKQGDLLRVFTSITQAETLIELDINLETDNKYYQNYQKDMDRGLWCKLFALRLPARLTKPDGTIIDGVLEPFTEQGMEGHIAWSLYDFSDLSYGSLHSIVQGDHLAVFSRVLDGKTEWEGRVELDETPQETGRNITLVMIDPENPSRMDFDQRPEIIAKTYKNPSLITLDRWSLRNLPVHIVN